MDGGPLRSLLRAPRALVDWLCSGREDYDSFQSRKTSTDHRRCKRFCLWIWIVAAAIMAIWPEIPVILGLILAATFLCFALLDRNT